MISLSVLFWVFVFMFAMIGAMRGWAKEILVTAGAILAIFVITILETYIPFVRDNLTGTSSFWMHMAIVLGMTLFAYQGPNIPRVIDSRRFVRDRFGDVLLGFFIGGMNGYMIFGTIWYFLIKAGYPFPWISPPDVITESGQSALRLIEFLPPQWLHSPVIYIAVAIAFALILMVLV